MKFIIAITFFFLFLVNVMISIVTVTAIPVAKIPPIVLPAMHPPPQPKLHNNNVHTCIYVKLKLTYVHTYAHKYHHI